MRETDWRNTAYVISVGFLILLTSLVLLATGYDELLLSVMSIVTPLLALILGVVGLRIYSKDKDTKDDRFNTFNYWFAIGMIILSLAEITGTLVRLTFEPQQIILIVALVQLPGLFLWGIGILQYLNSMNAALGYIKSQNLWLSLFFTTTLATISLVVIIVIGFPTIGFIESLVISPIIVGLMLFIIITAGFVMIFRKGSLAKPLFLILGALLLFLVRCLLWLFSDVALEVPTDRVIAAEAFILCGAALLMARSLGNIDT